MAEFSHIKDDKAYMVDVTGKKDVSREAVAAGRIYLREETLIAIRKGDVVKGNVLATARIAAIQAVKQTHHLIPMCHPLPVGGVEIDFNDGGEENYIEAFCTVKTYGKTGVEMEALTGVSVALLTIWDMVKSAEKDEEGQYPETGIEDIHVVEKKKGI
ncbi:cyclic pyranopterin monophosphate synthase MoaC [Methanoplanus sp. FWC-SCC4]|uniref:Probable cyclic pyranopterin monophosphate synthase n=1 Tax=Methanochimaera problematica TaxID=2609417 RepID=A0AA97I2L6_9EURY|nr:cyclic pyranopterin monophosphate synthase MoaC [Methanoplanus sp. FWC-SCC4]WOF16410.1 cyclic pyranopterin monophosphate synthase MoaC [Methanoplanus sp. FWC-SCC4]